jgi:uncharacterized protein YbjT (DUF2867 family)
MKLLLLGATGLVGDRTLTRALASNGFSEVIAPTRKPLAPRAKLVNPVVAKLEDFLPFLPEYKPDAIICALGTTIAKAGSQKAFRHVDYELPIQFGRAAHAAGVGTYALVSFMGGSADSRFFYGRTKGEVERDIQKIGFRSLTICKPNFIGGKRNEARPLEASVIALLRLLAPILPKKYHVNPAETIAAALLDAVTVERLGCTWIQSKDLG